MENSFTNKNANSTTQARLSVFSLLFMFGLIIVPAGFGQDLVVTPNKVSLAIGDEPTELLITRAGVPVQDVKCKFPVASSEDSVHLENKLTAADGKIRLIPKGPSQGMVLVCSDASGAANVYIIEVSMRSSGSICDDLEKLRTEAQRLRFFNKMNPPLTDKEIDDTLIDCERDKIVVSPTILDYKTVRDNYGKGIGESFVVIQVNVQNRSSTSKFFLQNVEAALDPNRCTAAKKFFADIYYTQTDANGNPIRNDESAKHEIEKLQTEFLKECITRYQKFFQYPIAMSAISRDKVIGVANANLYRSPRRIGFQIANFVSSMSPVLTGLKWLGRDGKLGFGFLGSTIIPEAEKGIPSISDDKMKSLDGAIKNGEIIIEPGKSEVVNIFVESRYFFTATTFNHYRASAKKASKEDVAFNRLLKLFLVSTVDGILISNDAPKVTSNPGGGIPNAEKYKFQ